MNEHEIEYVYKYRTFSRNHLQAMFENKIWYSVSSEFNDPFDASENLLSNNVKVGEIIQYMEMYAPDALERCRDTAAVIRQDLANYIFDLFQDGSLGSIIDEPINFVIENLRRAYIFSTCRCWNNNSMWSHYGDYHKGFCVRYNVKKLKECGVSLRSFKPVKYSDSTISPLSFFIDPRTKDDAFAVVDEAIFCKSLDYKLEKEFRFVLEQVQKLPHDDGDNFKNNSVPIVHPESAVDRIYFGYKANDFDKMQLQSLLDKREIEYFNLEPARDGTFNLLETPL